jgi:hypothetical protein
METIGYLVVLMIVVIAIAKNREEMGTREYLIIFLVTVAQVALVVYFLYTVERPPLT